MTDNDHHKALFEACRYGDLEPAEYALDHGAHPDWLVDHQCPLSIAVQHGHPHIVAVLLKRGAHILSNLESPYNDPSDGSDGMTPLAYAIQAGPEMLTVLFAESDRYPDMGREAAPDKDGNRGTRYIDMIKRGQEGAVYRVLSMVYGSKAERALLKMESEAIILRDGGRVDREPSANN